MKMKKSKITVTNALCLILVPEVTEAAGVRLVVRMSAYVVPHFEARVRTGEFRR